MTVNGNVDLSQQQNVHLSVYGRLPHTALFQPNAAATTSARVYYAGSGSAAGSLTGNATVVFGGAGPGQTNHLDNFSNLAGAAGTLTIGSGVTIRGKNGWIAGNSVVNQGTISADTAGGTIRLLGSNATATFTNTGTLS